MKFSPKQEEAISAVNRWYKKLDKRVFKIFGYAGTGKTTLAKHFAEGIKGQVLYASFTGKAAMVMRKSGCVGASTIHSLIYKPDGEAMDEDENGSDPKFKLNFSGKMKDAKLLIIDECSMVDEKLGRDLLRFNVPILVLGDPGQLPPVNGGGFFTNGDPDILLTEIHRQAADNPIIRFATDVREGRALQYGDYGSVKIIERADINAQIVTAADQVLVGKNLTRRKFNGRIRELAGFKGNLPMLGDRLVALQNDGDRGILNGGLWSVADKPGRFGKKPDFLTMIVRSLDEEEMPTIKVRVHQRFFTDADFRPNYRELKGTQQFDYGYALTTHKAQGSQWPNVVLFDESRTFKDGAARWLYTGITRASETLTVVK